MTSRSAPKFTRRYMPARSFKTPDGKRVTFAARSKTVKKFSHQNPQEQTMSVCGGATRGLKFPERSKAVPLQRQFHAKCKKVRARNPFLSRRALTLQLTGGATTLAGAVRYKSKSSPRRTRSARF